jgi:hypothetical protein
LISVLSLLKPVSITQLGPLSRWEYDNFPFVSCLHVDCRIRMLAGVHGEGKGQAGLCYSKCEVHCW